MNRRRFVATSGVGALASQFAAQAQPDSKPVLMKLGCQSAPTNDTHLKYLARYGVRYVSGYPEIADGRLYATVDELKRMLDLAEKNGITIEGAVPPFLASSHIDRECGSRSVPRTRFDLVTATYGRGHPWTIVRPTRRKEYVDALEAASADRNMLPFAEFSREEMSVDWAQEPAWR